MSFARGGAVRGGALLCFLALAACGGGGNEPGHSAGSRTVTLTWDANRESAVNRAGGGYEVFINSNGNGDGCCTFDVPYSGGPAAPTSITVQLSPGSYLVSVRAYGALDRQRTASSPVPLEVE